MKKNILILVIIIIIIVGIVVAINLKDNDIEEEINEDVFVVTENENRTENTEKLDDGTKINVSSALQTTKTVDGFTFENMQLSMTEGKSVFLADVTNTSDESTSLTLIYITFLDEDGNEIVTIGGIISELNPGETTQLNASATMDFTYAYDFEITIK